MPDAGFQKGDCRSAPACGLSLAASETGLSLIRDRFGDTTFTSAAFEPGSDRVARAASDLYEGFCRAITGMVIKKYDGLSASTWRELLERTSQLSFTRPMMVLPIELDIEMMRLEKFDRAGFYQRVVEGVLQTMRDSPRRETAGVIRLESLARDPQALFRDDPGILELDGKRVWASERPFFETFNHFGVHLAKLVNLVSNDIGNSWILPVVNISVLPGMAKADFIPSSDTPPALLSVDWNLADAVVYATSRLEQIVFSCPSSVVLIPGWTIDCLSSREPQPAWYCSLFHSGETVLYELQGKTKVEI